MAYTRENQLQAFNRLLDVMDELREKCPWDHKQTIDSLRPNTIEEVYELSDAIMNHDMTNISKELGDVLLHIVFYSKIGSETGDFDIADVCNKLCDKLIFRHPHVYPPKEEEPQITKDSSRATDADQVVKNWEQIKQVEKGGNKSVLAGVPNSLPPLLKAYRMQDKARAVGFDWEHKDDVWDKVTEEIAEFRSELMYMEEGEEARKKAQGELGDLLFSIVNASRLYDLNPDTALEATCIKFRSRFGYVEQKAKEAGRNLKDMTLGEMDALWDEAKKLEK
ncbi:MAG: nucleoside triphosphate pyrophosphohydrolase [Bacteroidales bacterium]|nr:nucleoside triphosphate pyrophosphohydrolase [Candidatus Equibacterium intestinale]